jgi:RNA polymerase sigma-70 factor (ECF subfamily)
MTDSHELDEARSALPPSQRGGPAPEFVSLFLAHQWRIHRYIVALLSTQQDAEDLVQETAALLWRKFDEFERGTSFFAWACKTAYLLVLEYRRRKGREATPLNHEVLEQLADFASQEDSSVDIHLSALDQCLQKLTPKDRELVERCYALNVKVKEIATQLGRSEKSIRKSLGRVRRLLIECVRRTLAVAEHGGGSS